jgi:hypothetical protein
MSCVGDVMRFEFACLAIESMANVLAKVVRGLENIINIRREEQRKTDMGPSLLGR